MLFPSIKEYFIEIELDDSKEDESYIADLEDCRSLEQLQLVVMNYHNLIDELEAASFILNTVCN
jgi:hypothetical protein